MNVGQGAIAIPEKLPIKSSQTNPSKKKRKTSVLYGHGSRRVGQMTEQVMKAYGVPKGYVQSSGEGKLSERKHGLRR